MPITIAAIKKKRQVSTNLWITMVLWGVLWGVGYGLEACASPAPGSESISAEIPDAQQGNDHTDTPQEKAGTTETTSWQKKPPQLSACLLKKDCMDWMAMGHRGTMLRAPENTLAAVQEAHRLGADIAEIDVRLSKEGVPILLHDDTVDRTSEGTGKASQKTVQELKNIKLKCPEKAQCTGQEQIATLEEVVEWSRGKIILNLDMKTNQLQPVVEVLRRLQAQDFVFLFLSSDDEYNAYRTHGQGFMMMPRADDAQSAKTLVSTWQQPLLHLDPRPDILTTELQTYLSTQGVKIMLNALAIYDSAAVEAPEAYLPLVQEFGARVIQTDRLDLLVPFLRKLNQQRNP